jgi:glycerol uptake facilitator-like aquaporin
MSRFPWSKVGPYILFQIIGSFFGTATTYLVFNEAINAQHNLEPLRNQTDLRAFGHPLSTGGIFATYPAPHVSLLGVLTDQVISTI